MTDTREPFATLGTINSYAEKIGIDPTHPEVLREYTSELTHRRKVAASQIGITVDELRLVASANPEVSPDNTPEA